MSSKAFSEESYKMGCSVDGAISSFRACAVLPLLWWDKCGSVCFSYREQSVPVKTGGFINPRTENCILYANMKPIISQFQDLFKLMKRHKRQNIFIESMGVACS